MTMVRAHHRKRPSKRTFTMKISPEARRRMLDAAGAGRAYAGQSAKRACNEVAGLLDDILLEYPGWLQFKISRERIIEMRDILRGGE
jgi:hypothetical protein